MIHRVRSRVRFQVFTKKVKQGDDKKAQRKPTIRILGSAQEWISIHNTVEDEPLFAKKRVRSTDELGDLLRSNISSSLSAAKTGEAQQDVGKASPSPAHQHIERLQEDGDDLSAPPSELTSSSEAVTEQHLATKSCAPATGDPREEDVSNAALLATTVIYRPVHDIFGSTDSGAVVSETVNESKEQLISHTAKERVSIPEGDQSNPVETCAVFDEDEDGNPPASLLATASLVVASSNDTLERISKRSNVDVTVTRSRAIGDDGGSVASDSSHHSEPKKDSITASLLPQKPRSRVLQRVVTLFAGRRRGQDVEHELPGIPAQIQDQTQVIDPSLGLQQPHSNGDEQTVHTTSPSPLRPLPPLRRATMPFADSTSHKSIPCKNLPLSPPILAPCRPHLPVEERLSEPFIPPARAHKYTGTYYVVPDVFKPVEVQLGFPSVTTQTSPISPMRRHNSEAQLLDRDETAWGKWYAKNPTAEHLFFAKANDSQRYGQEPTEQEVWDKHVAFHAQFRKQPPPPETEEELLRQREDEEHERADRLRYHTGHCFDALTGSVYPYQGGHII
ncbi:hypothetical protein OPT61_g3410 [Boeremia exigua]|uniref:Uncharacterized protein n=1 Tax=Boeremia exigua TaxID=749465 RepID=A0ACC2IHX6_9PLEO|nr:hypothetical protein OPT61_g3410 [Boeremia exigua]